MTNQQLVPVNGANALTKLPGPQAFSFADLTNIGTILANSGFFSDTKGAAQAIAKVLAGQELGIGPVASMTGLYIINGKVVISANVMAGAVKRSGRYDYRIRKLDNDACEIEFFEHGQGCGVSTFDSKDAAAAKLTDGNWLKFRRNMLFARALSNGVRWYCPDVFSAVVYTPDEMGAEVNEEGEITRTPDVEPPARPADDPDAARRHFWATARELADDHHFMTPDGRFSKRAVHRALGAPEEEGGLVPYAERYGWDQLRKWLEDQTKAPSLTTEPDILDPDDLPPPDPEPAQDWGQQADLGLDAPQQRAASARGA